MSTSISIKFLRPAVATEVVRFSYYANYPDTTEYIRGMQAVATRTNPGEFSIGANVTVQAQNYYNAFLADYGSNFSATLSGDTVIIVPNNESAIFNAYTILQPPFTQLVEFTITEILPDIDPEVIKCRSPYLLIKPSDIGGTCGIYTLGTTGATAQFTYQQCLTGNTITQEVGPSSIEYTDCAIIGTVTGPSGTTITYDSACDGSFDYDTTKYVIKAWTGDVATPPSAISYSKTKQKVVNSQTDIYINLSNLVKEKLEGDVDNYVLSTGLTASPIGLNESKWVNVLTTFEQANTTVDNIYYDDYFFVLDGYTEPGEAQGLIKPFTPGVSQNILMSNWYNREYTRYTKAKIHFRSKDLVAINASPAGSTSSAALSFDTGWNESDKYIQAVDIDTSQDMIYTFSYGTSSDVVRTHVTDNDCKYQLYSVIFKNKWGVLESISFAKKSSRTITIEDSSYLRSIVDYNGSFNVSRHTNKAYNTSGYEEWTLNTDWLPEYMNIPLQELMLSEEIWLYDGYKSIPVNKSETSFNFKTHVNDKMIQYTMKFKLSHNTINNIL